MTFPHTLIRWDADALTQWAHETPTSADGPAARVVLGGPLVAAHNVGTIIPTWAAVTPPGSWVEVQVRVCLGAADGQVFRIAAWDSAASASRRTSFAAQHGPAGHLSTDTLLLSRPAETLQARVLLCAEPGAALPTIESLALCLTAQAAEARPSAVSCQLSAVSCQPSADSRQPTAVSSQLSADSRQPSALRLPLLLSQYLSFPKYGHLWCSPTSLAMVLAYWHERTGDAHLAPFLAPESVSATVAPMVYDPGWGGTGNWAFNTAFAGALGLTAYVSRMHSLAQLARWTNAGVPVPLSMRWEPGELDGAAGRSAGHITVVTGFVGDRVLMAEPAARDLATIVRSYRADQLYACWQRASEGVVYLIHPQGWPTPKPGDGDAWD